MSELAALELEHRLAQREKRIHEVELELAKLKEEKEGFRCQLVNERNDYFNEHQRANELESQLAESKKQVQELVEFIKSVADSIEWKEQGHDCYSKKKLQSITDSANAFLSKHKLKGK